jgi:hypothetical protein
MKRRTLLATLGTVTATGTAGCNSVMGGNGGENGDNQTPSETNTPAAPPHEDHIQTADEALTSIYTTLENITLLRDQTFVAEEASKFNPESLFEDLQTAEQAVEEVANNIPENEDPPQDLERMRGATLLARTQIVIYGRGFDLTAQKADFESMINADRFADARDLIIEANDWSSELISNVNRALEIFQIYESEDISTDPIPNPQEIKSTSESLATLSEDLPSALTALRTWSDAVSRGVTASILIDEERIEAANATYITGIQQIDTAKEAFQSVDGPIPVFQTAVTRWNCGLDTLRSAYEHGEKGTDALMNGDDDTAEEELAMTNEEISDYRDRCLQNN